MKRSLLFLLMGNAFLFSCKDDSEDIAPASVPEVMQTTLAARFPGATNIGWEKAGELYEVDFDLATVEYDAQMAADGTILKYKHDVLVTELPEAITAALKTNYPNLPVEDPEKLFEKEQLYYQIELEDGNSDRKLVFSETGEELTAPAYWE